jgi:hypothetical protein
MAAGREHRCSGCLEGSWSAPARRSEDRPARQWRRIHPRSRAGVGLAQALELAWSECITASHPETFQRSLCLCRFLGTPHEHTRGVGTAVDMLYCFARESLRPIVKGRALNYSFRTVAPPDPRFAAFGTMVGYRSLRGVSIAVVVIWHDGARVFLCLVIAHFWSFLEPLRSRRIGRIPAISTVILRMAALPKRGR